MRRIMRVVICAQLCEGVYLDAVLQTVELPAGVCHLAAGLADVDGDTFPHCEHK